MTPTEREAAGQRIARARRRRGLSQAVLAGLVGRSESWLSQIERGKRGVDSHSVLVRLAEVEPLRPAEPAPASDTERQHPDLIPQQRSRESSRNRGPNGQQQASMPR